MLPYVHLDISCNHLADHHAAQVWTGENSLAKDIVLDAENHVINQACATWMWNNETLYLWCWYSSLVHWTFSNRMATNMRSCVDMTSTRQFGFAGHKCMQCCAQIATRSWWFPCFFCRLSPCQINIAFSFIQTPDSFFNIMSMFIQKKWIDIRHDLRPHALKYVSMYQVMTSGCLTRSLGGEFKKNIWKHLYLGFHDPIWLAHIFLILGWWKTTNQLNPPGTLEKSSAPIWTTTSTSWLLHLSGRVISESWRKLTQRNRKNVRWLNRNPKFSWYKYLKLFMKNRGWRDFGWCGWRLDSSSD